MSRELDPAEVRAALHRAADRIADYLEGVGRYPVLPRVAPGEVARRLPEAAPQRPEPLDRILDDYESLIEPNVTHWNHPGFMAYFAITGSAPGVIGEALAAALNVNAMLWRTSPAATELELRVCDWLRRMVGLPEGFFGHINDTASTGTLVALAAARHRLGLDVRAHGLAGRPEVPPLTLYTSEQAHSSVDKAGLVLGLGVDSIRRLPTDDRFRMDPAALEAALARDLEAGRRPLAVAATLGTTSTTSVDPVAAIAAICRRHGIWLHVDAAYGGALAVCPEHRGLFAGWECADSIVVNPHKWLFTPVDCSVLYVRDPANLKAAFSLVPDYLKTPEEGVTNLMDTGFQLGRRFRSLKLWMVLRAYGVEAIADAIRDHCRMARELAGWIEAADDFTLAAPVPMSAVCFRWLAGGTPEEEDRANEALLARVNAAGPVMLSQTVLDGRYCLRAAIGNLKTGDADVARAWEIVRTSAAELAAADGA